MSSPEEISVAELLRKLSGGEISPSSLSHEQILDCVDALDEEGVSNRKIGNLIGYSDRHIRRFKNENEKRHAFKTDADFAAKKVGSYIRKTEANLALLEWLLRKAETFREKVVGISLLIKGRNDYMSKLQSYGLISDVWLDDLKSAERNENVRKPGLIDEEGARELFDDMFSLFHPHEREEFRQLLNKRMKEHNWQYEDHDNLGCA